MSDIEVPWIKEGYRTFALKGPAGLKIERLAKSVGKSKSSFYHLFADLEVFTDDLLSYHLKQTKIIAEKESKCTDLDALIHVLVEHKFDLLFGRQLRVHRDNPSFTKCFLKTNEISMPSILPIWSEIIGLNDHSYLAKLVLQLSLENFFLQITAETLNPSWLRNYVNDIKTLVTQFKQTSSTSRLDGSV